MENPKRARSWKRRLRPRANLKNDVPVLYSTSGWSLDGAQSITHMKPDTVALKTSGTDGVN